MKKWCLFLAVAGIAGSFWISMASTLSQNLAMQSPVTGVWIGTQREGSSIELKSMSVVRYYPSARRLDLLRVPVETGVGAPFAQPIKTAGEFFKIRSQGGDPGVEEASRLLTKWVRQFFFNSGEEGTEISYYLRADDSLLENISQDPQMLFRSPKDCWNFLKWNQTNLTGFERWLLLWELREVKKKDVYAVQLPGQFLKNRWVSEPKDLMLTQQLFLRRSVLGAARQPETLKTTVEVWNGSDKKAIALELVHRLRKAGFDVVKWGNHPSKRAKTLVYDRKGRYNQVQNILSILPPEAELLTRIDHRALVDIEIILGGDYQIQNTN